MVTGPYSPSVYLGQTVCLSVCLSVSSILVGAVSGSIYRNLSMFVSASCVRTYVSCCVLFVGVLSTVCPSFRQWLYLHLSVSVIACPSGHMFTVQFVFPSACPRICSLFPSSINPVCPSSISLIVASDED